MLSRSPAPTALNRFLLLFALSAVLGVLPAYDSSLSVAALIAVLASIALYFAIALGARTPSAVRRAASIGVLAALAFALYFITQYGHLNYEKGGLIARLGEITTLLPDLGGFRPQPNAAATFMEIAVPLAWALALSSTQTMSKMAWGAGACLIAYAVFLTASRGSWLGLAGAAGLAAALTVLNRLPRRTALIVLIAGGLALLAGVAAVIALGPDRIPLLASTFSRATDRGRLFQNSLHLAGDYPFTGIGLGDTFAMIYSRYALMIQVPFLTYAHNLPLSVWLNQGLLGLIAFTGIVGAFYRFVHRAHRNIPAATLFHGAWLGVTVTLLHGLTDAPQYADGRWVMPMLFAWLGLAVASARTIPSPISIPPSRRISLAVVLTAIVVLVLIFNQPLRAAWYSNLGAIAETRAELNPSLGDDQRRDAYAAAVVEYEAALALDPAQASANRRLGNLLVKLDRFDEAAPRLEAAFAADPSRQATIKGLGLAYVWLGRIEEAVHTFRALENPQEMADELFTWGSYRTDQQRPLLAAYAHETAIALAGGANPNIWFLVADAYRAAGQVEAARAWYNRVLAAEPGNERALRALAALEP